MHHYYSIKSEAGEAGEKSFWQFMVTPQMLAVCCIPPAPIYIFVNFRLLLPEITARANKVRAVSIPHLIISKSQKMLLFAAELLQLAHRNLWACWSALRGLLLYHLEAWIQDWIRQDTLSVIFYPYIFHSSGYGIFQACYSPGSFEGLTLSEEHGVCTLHPSLHL